MCGLHMCFFSPLFGQKVRQVKKKKNKPSPKRVYNSLNIHYQSKYFLFKEIKTSIQQGLC